MTWSQNRQVFTGHTHDEASGPIYMGARYYLPEEGIFLTRDTYLGTPDDPRSLHRYLYAFGNPLLWIDPTGNGNEIGHFYQAYLAAKDQRL